MIGWERGIVMEEEEGRGIVCRKGCVRRRGKEIILVQVLEGKCKKEQEEMEVKEMNG